LTAATAFGKNPLFVFPTVENTEREGTRESTMTLGTLQLCCDGLGEDGDVTVPYHHIAPYVSVCSAQQITTVTGLPQHTPAAATAILVILVILALLALLALHRPSHPSGQSPLCGPLLVPAYL
ncbi:hypothetical protein V491_08817, partial [Pseudogymnoascus sp. VKM F-3775]